jgi:hypothetical protein
LDGVRGFNEDLYAARPLVEDAVNEVLKTRKKEKYEYPGEFSANVAFCNLYANAAECVGYHADQLTYLGPHPTIASLSLGCEREVSIPTSQRY